MTEATRTDGGVAVEGGHVKMFYSRVLDEFLGPSDADMTFSQIENEYGGVEQWAEGESGDDEDVEVPDVEDIEPGTDGDEGSQSDSTTPDLPDDGAGAPGADDGADAAGADDGASAATPEAPDDGVAADFSPADIDFGDDADSATVDERRREWFAAGFREGVEFALRNPDLFGRN